MSRSADLSRKPKGQSYPDGTSAAFVAAALAGAKEAARRMAYIPLLKAVPDDSAQELQKNREKRGQKSDPRDVFVDDVS